MVVLVIGASEKRTAVRAGARTDQGSPRTAAANPALVHLTGSGALDKTDTRGGRAPTLGLLERSSTGEVEMPQDREGVRAHAPDAPVPEDGPTVSDDLVTMLDLLARPSSRRSGSGWR